MAEAFQIREYNTMNNSIPCVFRGPLQVDTKHVKASPCCQARDLVSNPRFLCSLLEKKLTSPTSCWHCKLRKEKNDPVP